MNDKLNEAMNEISDRHLAEATRYKRSHTPVFTAIAAVLILAILVGVFAHTMFSPNPEQSSGQIAAPVYPAMVSYPVSENGFQYNEADYTAWQQNQAAQHNQPQGYANNLDTSLTQITSVLLQEIDAPNAVCSPLNIYMALAMLAESTDGTSREQILQLFNAEDIESLRTQAGHVWNAHYCNDGATTSILANSLWLDEAFTYDPATVNTLSRHYYASLFRGDLGSSEMNQSLQDWLNTQTAGLLSEQVQQIKLDPSTALALASTVCYRAKWVDTFSKENNSQNTFSSPVGEIPCTFMNRTLYYGTYYYGEDYSATRLSLEDGSTMWLILPDEGHSPESILQSGNALNALLLNQNAQSVSIRVNLSVPKFDVVSDTNLIPALSALGITDVFDPNVANFTPILPEDNAYINQAQHAARVAIDEEGVTAAAYTVIAMAGAAPPPEDEIDFILDRPFLFLVTSRDNLPLFAGIVNEP